jgi:membrane-associated protease RseP (regulator of RpoE activity)
MFLEPPPSQYDLRFRLLDVPVRVHPFFWLLILFGARNATPGEILIWAGVLFVSIVVHEFGHVLAFRYYGISSHVVLHGFGGLAIPNMRGRLHPRASMLISFAGPLAGFLLAGVLLLGLRLSGVGTQFITGFPRILDWYFFDVHTGRPMSLANDNLEFLFNNLLFVNIFWGLVNLLPIYPLDGGQISRAAFQESRTPDALRKSLILSMAAAIAMALYGLRQSSFFITLMFGFMAYENYRELQGQSYRGRW